MSGDPEQEYFSDGITEDIITDLSKVSALAVVSRNTAFTFKGKHAEVAQVARQLKVTHVVEGSVRKSGNRVRITAQLIDGATDSHLWAERYDRDLDDIFALQDEIAEAIVKALKLQLLPDEKKAIEQRSTTNPEAYKLYLMARQYNATGNSRHREITVRLCQRAVEIDPEYARAWALLAISQSNKRLIEHRDRRHRMARRGARAGAPTRSRRSARGQGAHSRRRGPLRRGAGRSTRPPCGSTRTATRSMPRPRAAISACGATTTPSLPRKGRRRNRDGFLGARHGYPVLRGRRRHRRREVGGPALSRTRGEGHRRRAGSWPRDRMGRERAGRAAGGRARQGMDGTRDAARPRQHEPELQPRLQHGVAGRDGHGIRAPRADVSRACNGRT